MQDRDMDTSQEDILASFREERLEQRKKKPAILIGVSIGIFLAVAIGWMTFGRYVSVYYGVDSEELPVVRADSSVDGMRPETPGGMEVPNRDKLVYERLRQNNTELPVEKLLPSVEKPKKPEVKETAEAVQKNDQDAIALLAANIIQQEELSSAMIYEEDGTPVEVMFKEVPSEKEAVAASEKETASKTQAATSEKEAVQNDEQKTVFMVQLVSARSESAAESEWKRLSKKHKEIIGKQSHMVSKTVVSSGTFYRLRVGRFEKREDAVALCEQLKTKKQECFVVK